MTPGWIAMFMFDPTSNFSSSFSAGRSIALLLDCQGIDEYKAMLPAGLNLRLVQEEVKEIVHALNEALTARGSACPCRGASGDHNRKPP